jgi:hypothetical protein
VRVINLKEYISNMEIVLQYNPPLFGFGLRSFDRAEVEDHVKALYGRWFVRSEFHSKMPDINNRKFVGWIYEAMDE